MGDDPASRTYVNNKKKACAQAGIYSEEYALPATTSQAELMELVEKLNAQKGYQRNSCPVSSAEGLGRNSRSRGNRT